MTVVASDEEKYKAYVEIRRRSEHESSASTESDKPSSVVFGEFMKQWISFEKSLQEAARAQGLKGSDLITSRSHIQVFATLDPDSKQKLEWIRFVRNRAVHGHGEINIDEMREATLMLKQILKQLSPAKKSLNNVKGQTG
ncbi:MAG: hypothetical protein K2P84_09510 [Undibacterium sp.]|nr:hypothetical protein [Undibacterium sp.]